MVFLRKKYRSFFWFLRSFCALDLSAIVFCVIMEMECLTEFPHTHMDRRPRKRPRLAWDVPQAPKVVLVSFWSNIFWFHGCFARSSGVSLVICLDQVKFVVFVFFIWQFGGFVVRFCENLNYFLPCYVWLFFIIRSVGSCSILVFFLIIIPTLPF